MWVTRRVNGLGGADKGIAGAQAKLKSAKSDADKKAAQTDY
ncbi:hypothetical protein OAL55_03470 [Verrucomicrobiales bacterium]|nr:hypothetical protein [Verrucomicrobiales bacterium]